MTVAASSKVGSRFLERIRASATVGNDVNKLRQYLGREGELVAVLTKVCQHSARDDVTRMRN